MPTTARLVAAVLMAALGWGISVLSVSYLPDGQPVGLFAPISAAWGAVVGWTWTGGKIQNGSGRPVGIGLAGVAILVFWVSLSFSLYEMVRQAVRVRYDGPVEALEDMFKIAIDYLRDQAQPDIILALLVGGVVIGFITGWTARRFR
jgi:hypothetical protein